MTTPHQTTKECLIRNFQELNGSDEVFSQPNYQKQFNIAVEMISTLFEIETARKMFSDIYESMLAKCPDKLDWFIRKIWKSEFPYMFDDSNFDKLNMAIDIIDKYGCKVEYAISILHDTHGHVIECHYTPKNSEFRFESLLDYDKVLTAVSEYKDVALLDTCDFGIPEHKEIPIKYDIANMSLNEICEAYLNIGGLPIIIEP